MDTVMTGLDQAPQIPVGSTITTTGWHITEHYTVGDRYETEADALREAIRRVHLTMDEYNARGQAFYGGQITIDLRWFVAFPEGGGMDFPARRMHYPSVGQAQEHLDRIERIAAIRAESGL